MTRGHSAATAFALAVCLLGVAASAQDPQAPTDSAARKQKPAQDAGFKPPETVAPTPTTHQQQQDTNFKVPDTVTPAEQPAKTHAVQTISLGTNPLMGSARARLVQARDATTIRAPGGEPFRMHAVFSAMSDPELATGGTYSELWLSPTRWRREAVVGEVHVLESRDGDKLYRTITGREYAPRLLDDLMDTLYLTFPALDDTFAEGDWQQGTVLYEKTSAFRISTGFASTPLDADARAYWLTAEGIPIATYYRGSTVEYEDYEPWSRRQVARHLNLKQDAVKVAGIWLDQLETVPAETGTQFALDGVTPIPLGDEAYSGPYFVPPHPVHQVSPKDAPSGEGTVFIAVHLDHHGHVRGAKVQKGINDALDAVAMKAAMQWEFSPALIKGRPTESDATVQFVF